MALQWFLLGVVAAVEAVVLLLLSAPMPHEVSKQVLAFVRRILQPGLAVVPFALFQLLGLYETGFLEINYPFVLSTYVFYELQRFTGSTSIALIAPSKSVLRLREIVFKDR